MACCQAVTHLTQKRPFFSPDRAFVPGMAVLRALTGFATHVALTQFNPLPAVAGQPSAACRPSFRNILTGQRCRMAAADGMKGCAAAHGAACKPFVNKYSKNIFRRLK
jgi:hypothetical protein